MGEVPEESVNEESQEVVEDMQHLLGQADTPGEISINALYGSNSINTIRLQGVLRGKKISILVDSGSTHSFIDLRMIKQM